MPRKGPSPEQQIVYGRLVRRAREEGQTWKAIGRRLGYGKTRLYQFVELAQLSDMADKCVHEHNSAGQAEKPGDKVVPLRRATG